MIKLATEKYQSFIDYLNKLHYTNEPCQIVVLPLHSTIGDLINDEEDNIGFACYGPNNKLIYVAGNMDEMARIIKLEIGIEPTNEDLHKYMLQNIAHEYKHHLQNVNGEEFNEEEAEEFGHKIVNKFLAV